MLERIDVRPPNISRISDNLGNGCVNRSLHAKVLRVQINEGNFHKLRSGETLLKIGAGERDCRRKYPAT